MTDGLLENRVAVVTGSSSGIGRAMALRLAASGCDVIVHAATSNAEAQTVSDEIGNLGRESTVICQDFARHEQLEDFVERCWQWRGSVQIWINNAGIDVLTGDAATWDFRTKLDAVLQVDVTSTILLSRLVGRRMTTHDGSRPRPTIINIGWDQVAQGMAGDSGEMFAASKGAVMAFSKSLAQSLAPNVRVNAIAPGWIKTEWGQSASPSWQDRACHESLSVRWGIPEDVAALAAFLTSDEADFINGQIIAVNGGFRFGDQPGHKET
ncbi:MAG: SDR family NAD(P)-dependent oxidoreductase [Pirellulaceae bacterium]